MISIHDVHTPVQQLAVQWEWNAGTAINPEWIIIHSGLILQHHAPVNCSPQAKCAASQRCGVHARLWYERWANHYTNTIDLFTSLPKSWVIALPFQAGIQATSMW